jgi:hypothetical protein
MITAGRVSGFLDWNGLRIIVSVEPSRMGGIGCAFLQPYQCCPHLRNGKPMTRIYGPTDTKLRGGTVTLYFYGPDQRLLDYRRIEELASEERISLRTGCLCNPGAGEMAEGLTAEDMLAGLNDGPDLNLPHFLQVVQHRGNKSAGAIRVSVGLATNFSDVYRFIHFAAGFQDKQNMNIGKVTFDIQSCRAIRDGN